jgi:hypothetical protein
MTSVEFEDFLESIGGLFDGRSPGRRPIIINICQCDEGWLELIKDLILELIAAGWNKEVRQIKEKFGGLSFYTNDLTDKDFAIIHKYALKSFHTCEICGSIDNVKLRRKNWVKTLCEKHDTII